MHPETAGAVRGFPLIRNLFIRNLWMRRRYGMAMRASRPTRSAFSRIP